jgi:hypothetical protein
MKNNKVIIGICAALVAGLIWLFWVLNPKEKYNWYETYRIKDKDPYGTYVMGELLKHYYPGKKFILSDRPVHETLALPASKERSSYVFVGEALYLDSADVQVMMRYVDQGNDVFIASLELPRELTLNFRDFQCYWRGYNFAMDSLVKLNFTHPALGQKDPYPYVYAFKGKNMPYRWAWLDTSYLCGSNNTIAQLGYYNTPYDSGRLNFICIPYGRGNFYFHTTPLAFTNYFLVKERSLDYAGKVMSHLKPGDIYWDEYSRIPHFSAGNNHDRDGANNPGGKADSPLQFLLQQRSMRWAWFTLLFGVVLTFLLFRTKRRQRIIPLLEANTNTSLEFVQTIGRLYFLQNNHRGLCKQMMRHFLAFIRNKYYFSTVRINEELMLKIAERSRVDINIIKDIFTRYNLMDKTSTEITDNELIAFHQSLENFYKNCK